MCPHRAGLLCRRGEGSKEKAGTTTPYRPNLCSPRPRRPRPITRARSKVRTSAQKAKFPTLWRLGKCVVSVKVMEPATVGRQAMLVEGSRSLPLYVCAHMARGGAVCPRTKEEGSTCSVNVGSAYRLLGVCFPCPGRWPCFLELFFWLWWLCGTQTRVP